MQKVDQKCLILENSNVTKRYKFKMFSDKGVQMKTLILNFEQRTTNS